MRLKLYAGASFGAILIAVGFVAFGGEDTADRPGFLLYDDAETIAAGQAIYGENCAVCHGDNLQGAEDWRGRDDNGLLLPPPHDDAGHTWHHADAVLFELTKFGSAAYVGSGYQSAMAGFEFLLTDEQILQTLAFIKSTWSPQTIEIHNDINASADLAE